jgi:hypothetical protein
LENNLYDKKWVSVFIYKDTFSEIKKYLLSKEDTLFFIFDERNNIS